MAEHQRDLFSEWESQLDCVGPHGWLDAEYLTDDPLLNFTSDLDRQAGEFFRTTWQRRLVDSQGDLAHVARQMRKAGVPLELALLVLLAPQQPAVHAGHAAAAHLRGPPANDARATAIVPARRLAEAEAA